MPQKIIRFKGINRIVNEYQNSGECEELINLRPGISGGHMVVKPKHVVKNSVPYSHIYEHTFADIYNQIVVNVNGIVDWIDKDGNIHSLTNKFYGKSVSVSCAGNVIVIYCDEDKYQQVFKFKDDEYEPYNVAFKHITSAYISYAYNANNPARNTATSAELSSAGLTEALLDAASGFYRKFPNGLCGAAVIGCTYELEDGTELWSTAFVVANVTRCNGYKYPNIDLENKGISVYGASKVSLRLEFDDTKADNIKKLNIYASRPVFPFEGSQATNSNITINSTSLEDANLGDQIMYYQGSVSLDQSSASFTLDFGIEQAGEDIMDVTAGCIERLGNTVSYNNRFHYYRSEVQHVIQAPTISDAAEARESSSYWISYVKFEHGWKLINGTFRFSEGVPNDFIYPMAGIKQMAFVKASWPNGGSLSVPYDEMFYVDLQDSSAYNYSYAFDVTPSVIPASEFYGIVSQSGQIFGGSVDRKVFMKNEANVINVSAPYNPYAFPVQYSYGFGGEIIDIATSYLPISTTQVGQYPLTVFTSNGTYALEQGNGEVLYSNITPINPMVMTGKAVATPVGTFFISSKNIYLLSGRDSLNISYILNGERELNLRELESYKRLCFDNSGMLFNFSPVLSTKDFEDFISDASLTYDQLNNELYISSNDENVNYSYVFNLDTKTYHKIIKKYTSTPSGGRYAIEVIGSDRNIVDLHKEERSEQPILLQSRPMSLEILYTHIQRMMLLVDTKLTGNQYLCLSLFGSDNLHDWKCIVSAQKHDTVLGHIRTNRAAKSFKNYIVLVNGTVSTEADLSDLIADYTVVNRRLG